jgi:hypothetical protein
MRGLDCILYTLQDIEQKRVEFDFFSVFSCITSDYICSIK